jgi:polar amino acid transport system substrate-binding protein
MKKKVFASLMAAAMVLSLCACGQKNDEVVGDSGVNDAGVLRKVGNVDNLYDDEIFIQHANDKHTEAGAGMPDDERLQYPNLSAALLALENEKIQLLASPKTTVDYIVAHNDKFQIADYPTANGKNSKSMLTAETNTELYGILDEAIKQLKADGTLDQLIEEELNAYITIDPTPAELPTFDGAKTYKIAVTGDLPPMDFVTADGKAAGFNVALLTEIANIAQVNFELVVVDADARLTSLASGVVDAVFWVIPNKCFICGESLGDAPEGTMITESYFSDAVAMLALK